MIPQTPDFLQLFETDHRRREDVAAAERLRRFVVGRVFPASVPPRTVTSPAAVHELRPASSHCREAA
jgi:hypothetical protein